MTVSLIYTCTSIKMTPDELLYALKRTDVVTLDMSL